MVFGLPVIALVVCIVHPLLAIPVMAYWLYVLGATVVGAFRGASFNNLPSGRQWVETQRQAHAQATGQAVVDGLRQAYQETQRPPDEPTGPSAPAPTPPTPPTPPAPMGSSTPTLWVPTYQGPQHELQRRETSLDGIWMNDHRRIDPDEL